MKTPKYTAPWGSREIYRDGKPFVILTRAESGEYVPPEEVDDFGREVFAALTERAALLECRKRLQQSLDVLRAILDQNALKHVAHLGDEGLTLRVETGVAVIRARDALAALDAARKVQS